MLGQLASAPAGRRPSRSSATARETAEDESRQMTRQMRSQSEYFDACGVELKLSDAPSGFLGLAVALRGRVSGDERGLHRRATAIDVARHEEAVTVHPDVGLRRIVADLHPTAHRLAH